MKKLIKVTQKHINKGCKYAENGCPIALALAEALGTPKVAAGDLGIKIAGTVYESPRSVARFVSKFDKLGKKGVKPFNFILDYDSRGKEQDLFGKIIDYSKEG